MGIAVPWRPGDGRSRRSDRVPVDMRVLGRILPTTPLHIRERLHRAMPLRHLNAMLELGAEVISRRLPELQGQLSLSNGHYAEVLGVLFGGHQRELLVPGTYVLTDSSPSQRVLYIGSSVDDAIRSRLISHLFEQGRSYLSQQAYRQVVAAIQAGGYSDEHEAELALRHALFGANRWAVSRAFKTKEREQATELVSYGAFDVAAVRVPDGYHVVARCIERYLVNAVRRRPLCALLTLSQGPGS